MFRNLLLQLVCYGLSLASAGAFACGQVGQCDISQPGAKTTIRGFGYGFEGGERAVSLHWKADGALAGQSKIDSDGNFQVEISVPATEGLHQLLVREGATDPSPVSVTVPVMIAPFYARFTQWAANMLPKSSIGPWLVALTALGLMLAAALGGLAASQRRTYNT